MSKPKRILIVDDDEASRDLLVAFVESLGHESETAGDGIEAIAKMKLGFDLILMDIMMPGMDGYEVTRQIRKDQKYSELPIIMTTALTSKDDRLRAVEAGANDYISKPVDKNELQVRMASLLKMKEAQDAVKHYRAELEEKVEQRTKQLRDALNESIESQREIKKAHTETIHRLVVAAEYKDEDTANHIKRMSHYSRILAGALHLSPGDVEIVHLASPLHDVGKIGTPDNILFKPAKHTPEEWEIMKQHTTFGGRILNGSSAKLLQAGEIIALSHHEKWDGSGYPKGISGEDIPLWGRITAVADVFDALTSKRPYKEPFSNEKSLQIMKEGRDKHFEPGLLDLFLENLDEVFDIQKKHKDA
jgi:putative two-component system response regulator